MTEAERPLNVPLTHGEPSRSGHARRVASLDGLRGVAAVVVVVHHVLLVSSPVLANPYRSIGAARPRSGSLDWWLSETPLHIVWAGPEAVLVFFVLSGYVLALPAVRRGAGWLDISYYPRRLVRLYLPVWGAMLFATIVHALQSTSSIAGASWVLDETPAVTLSGIVHTASVVYPIGTEDQFTGVLWSLQWEMVFSLLLPLLLLVPILTRDRPRLAAACAAACLPVIAIGVSHRQWANLSGFCAYMPVFVLGSLLAFHTGRLHKGVRTPDRRWSMTRSPSSRRVFTTALVAITVALLTTGYWTDGRGMAQTSWPQEIGIVAGALLALWLTLESPAVAAAFETRPLQWLGSRSFSLYLVHYPVVAALAFAYGGRPDAWLMLITAVPASLVAAEVFWRAVEHPATGLAGWAGHMTVGLHNRRSWSPGYPGELG